MIGLIILGCVLLAFTIVACSMRSSQISREEERNVARKQKLDLGGHNACLHCVSSTRIDKKCSECTWGRR